MLFLIVQQRQDQVNKLMSVARILRNKHHLCCRILFPYEHNIVYYVVIKTELHSKATHFEMTSFTRDPGAEATTFLS